MKISTLLKAISMGITAQATPLGGTVETTASPEETFSLLGLGTPKWRVILHWSGDAPTSQETDGQVATTISVTIQQPSGMQRQVGKDMVDSVSGRLPFYDLLDLVRLWMRSLSYQQNGQHHSRIDCYSICGDARPIILQDKDGKIIDGLRQAEFTYTIRRCLPWVETPILIDIPSDE
jgi:hypothetical protein